MKKVGLLGLVLVLCLAVVGVGYAHWTKDLSIDGTVVTGTFDAEMSQGTPTDNEPVEKDVAEPTCTLADRDNDGVNEAVDLLIVNAYPSYEATFPLDVHCIGSVPLHINDISITCQDPFLDVQIVDPDTGQFPDLPVQLHECQEYWFDVVIHVIQQVGDELCPEGETLGCSISITVDQFNHVP